MEIKCPYCKKGRVLKLLLMMQNFASKDMLMVCSNWTTPMYTINKYKHSYLFVILIIVTFVYVHSPKMKSMIFTNDVFL